MPTNVNSSSKLLGGLLAVSVLSTAIHYTHNFVAVRDYPGPGSNSFYTTIRVLIVLAWPLLTAIGITGYRRYREGRLREAQVCLCAYSITGLSTPAHFIYGDPRVPGFFYATLFTDGMAGAAIVAFVLWTIARSPARMAA